jgi:membrane protein required for colicin V production
MSNIPVIDMIFAILILLMVIHGYMRGFISEIFSWAAPVLAIGAAVFLYRPGSLFIRERMLEKVKYVPEILAFVAIFVIVMLFIRMIEYVLKNVIEGAKLGGLNKFIGFFFGIIEGIAIVTIILFILTAQPFFDSSRVIGDSFFAELLLPLIKIPFNRGKDILNTALLTLPGIWIPLSLV